jgi:hypothetical protein
MSPPLMRSPLAEDLKNILARLFQQKLCLLGQIRLSTLLHQHQRLDPTVETEPIRQSRRYAIDL